MKHLYWLFEIQGQVSRRAYFIVGFVLMLFKYGIDAGFLYFNTRKIISPWFYLTPIVSVKQDFLNINEGGLIGLLLVTLMFVWIGVSMTVRRLRDMGHSTHWALFFFVPFLNYLAMLVFAMIPSEQAVEPKSEASDQEDSFPIVSVLLGVFSGAILAVVVTFFCVYVFKSYGFTLFIGTPFVMGFVSSAFLNKKHFHSLTRTLMVSVVTCVTGGGLLLLFAVEGVLCLAMLAPFALILSLMGAVLARGFLQNSMPPAAILALVCMPLLAISEPRFEPDLREVATTIEINAPPEHVWEHVVSFSELPQPSRWFFNLGVAYPIRARIEGSGVGAVRYCEFSTGPFVEPITHWEEAKRLAFSVRSQPPTMQEWSPYQKVEAPHLTESLVSRRGEFRLVRLNNGGTRLEGSTWYTLDMAPSFYWTLWSDWLISSIHTRVLQHIKSEAEQ
ncbi:MAG: hypothetical protein CMK59_08515 [Proteobacteria bacterium]|nr:hypothetical protein [Pseudomonadota bacterium]